MFATPDNSKAKAQRFDGAYNNVATKRYSTTN